MGASDRQLVNRHLEALLAEAAQDRVPEDLLGRLLVEAAIGLWRNGRGIDDIAAELRYTAENLDPDLEYPFMRP
ncbi:MAG: hypothetical protein ACU85V_17140 [Gammaproteobacteria bacterium]